MNKLLGERELIKSSDIFIMGMFLKKRGTALSYVVVEKRAALQIAGIDRKNLRAMDTLKKLESKKVLSMSLFCGL